MSQLNLTEISRMFATQSTEIETFQKAGIYLLKEKFSVTSVIREAISDSSTFWFA